MFETARRDLMLATRACVVCEWRGRELERPGAAGVGCPLCHAPTRIVDEAIVTPIPAGKNPHAAALGRLGGLKGGRIRAQRLDSRRRREIARDAARARWKR